MLKQLPCRRLICLYVLCVLVYACTSEPKLVVDDQGDSATATLIAPSTGMGEGEPTLASREEAWGLNLRQPEIAYLSNRSGTAEVWLRNLVTATERRLTVTDCSTAGGGYTGPEWIPPGVAYFTWSSDGESLAVLSRCNGVGTLAHLAVIWPDSGTVITLTEPVSAKSYPDWSPSSDRFVFSYDPGLTIASELYIVHPRRNGTLELTQLTGLLDQGDLYYPKWSPDDEHLAFLGPGGAPVGTYLSITDFAGKHQTYLQPSGGADRAPNSGWSVSPWMDGIAWSRTGRYLAVASAHGWVNGHLDVVEISGQTATRHFGPDNYSSALLGGNFYTPLFSSDDERLYFVSVPEVEGILEWPLGGIFSVRVADVLNAAPREEIEVVPISPSDQVAGFPDLSADDKWLLYTVKQGEATEIWLQSTDGVYREPLIADGFLNMRPAWRPAQTGE